MNFFTNTCRQAAFALLLTTAAAVGQTVPSGYRVDIVAGNLGAVTTMTFLDATHLLVLEKSGTVYYVDITPAPNVPVLSLSVNRFGENGLLGIAKSPDFEKSGHVYLYYTPSGNPNGKIVRYRWNGTALVEGEDVLSVDFNSSGGIHYGGVLLFGPDEKLYFVLGDRNLASQTSNYETEPFREIAVILRLNEDGSAPIDNPFATPGWEKIYAYGVRNSFGLAFDRITGYLWDTENGGGYDEVNRIIPGMNSGWVDIIGPLARDPEGLTGLVTVPNAVYVDPEFSWTCCVAPTAIRFLDSCRWPASIRDDCFVASYYNRLYRFDMNPARTGFVLGGDLADKVADPDDDRNPIIWGDFPLITDIQLGSDGYMYVASYFEGLIYRIRPINPMGDLNLDGNVTLDDVPLFTSLLLDESGTPQELAVADFDGDGSVTGMDIPCFVDSLEMPN